MWIQLVVLILTLYLVPILLKKLKNGTDKLCEVEKTNKPKAESIVNDLSWYELARVILRGLTVDKHISGYELGLILSKRLGPLNTVKLPTRTYVTVCEFETAKKIMWNIKTWPDRLYTNHYMHVASFNKPLGLLFSCGEDYKRAHQITVKLLTKFGFYKPDRMESFILYEIEELESRLMKQVEENGGEYSFSPHTMFQVATLNVAWQVIAGTRHSYDDPTVHKLLHAFNKSNRENSILYTNLELVSFLKYFPKWTFLGSLQTFSDMSYEVVREMIAERRAARQSLDDDPQDFLDGFVAEVDKLKGTDEHMTEENLLVVMRDMLIAGGDTTNSGMEFALYLMAKHPRIQRKVQAEVDDVIGFTRQPSYSQRDMMPYTQAVLHEVLRIACPVPGTGRVSVQDSEIKGRFMPKGTQSAMSIYAINHDENVWEDPHAFKPERFLDEDMKIVNTEKLITFGFGKRACTGEPVARTTLFIFFVELMQKFTFKISPYHPPPKPALLVGLTRCPAQYYVTVQRR